MELLKLVETDSFGDEVWTAVVPEYNTPNTNSYSAIRIENGLKILCRKETLNNLLSNEEIKQRFQMNIRRKNRWYWSVYFIGRRII